MWIKLLKDVVESVVGKSAVGIVDVLYDKKDINEFVIAKKLNLTINQTRNILYKLSALGLVSSIRKKDKRKGWYIYFWTISLDKSLELLAKKLKDEIRELGLQLKNRREKRYYLCRTCNVEVSEETALLHNFTCQECGQVYALNEGEKEIKELTNRISRLTNELGKINAEQTRLREQVEKINKRKEKKIKKPTKKKKKSSLAGKKKVKKAKKFSKKKSVKKKKRR